MLDSCSWPPSSSPLSYILYLVPYLVLALFLSVYCIECLAFRWAVRSDW